MPHSNETARGRKGYIPLPETVATSSPPALLVAESVSAGLCTEAWGGDGEGG